jgi:hypothetical protein
MKKYTVFAKEVWNVAIPVFAEDEEAAIIVANERLGEGGLEAEYEYTLDTDEWAVEEE